MTIHAQKPAPASLAVKADEAARILGMSKSWLYQLRAKGEGPKYIKLSHNVVLYRVCDLEDYLAANIATT